MLRKICGSRKVLPTTYELSAGVSSVRQSPDAFGGFGDAYEGTLTVRVCIKRLKVSITGDPEKVQKVPLRAATRYLTIPDDFGDVLQRGCGMETPQPPEYCAFQGCHFRSPSTHFRMDARWRAARVCEKELGHGPYQSCRPMSLSFHAAAHLPHQSLGVAEGLGYLHSREVIHGDLKGVRVIVRPNMPY